ncbi:hypothetical protein [Mesorhizobium sp. 113-3-3]|uniref:hypothetical protein n=1 Tax=Mesorhizobium sp. 113-3-3 TaxID=2744516 RepID=UPI0019256522|nr:hypothetical protein [Mesorhizobium sp. 113-3-3]
MSPGSGSHRADVSNLLRIRFFAAMDFAHEHAFDQDRLVVGLLTAACSNARA